MAEIRYTLAKDRKLAKGTADAAGFDLEANERHRIKRHHFAVVGTGLNLEIPKGHEAQIRSRSGLAVQHGLFVLNSPGTIDSDYRGEVKIILFNLGNDTFWVNPGDRIAQLVFAKLEPITLKVVDTLTVTERGVAGFGSTGIKALEVR